MRSCEDGEITRDFYDPWIGAVDYGSRLLKLRLTDILGVEPGSMAAAIQRHVWGIWFDAEEALRKHMMRRVILGRYARQSVLQWGDTLVSDMEYYLELTVDLLKQEKSPVDSEDNGG